MNTTAEPDASPRLRLREIAAIIVFALTLIGWLSQLHLFALIAREWVEAPDSPGDAAIGMIFYGPAVLVVSFVLLLAAIASSQSADRLPRWFRRLTVALPAMGCLVGAAILFRAFS